MAELPLIEPGEIWTVPAIGPDALCLVVSSARGMARGRPEHQVAPLYPDSAFPATRTASDFRIERQETTRDTPLIAAVWNLRPLLAVDLGERIGTVVANAVLSDLRDAYLRMVDPSIRVAPGRIGDAQPDADILAWRRYEIQRWQPLTGRALSPHLENCQFARIVLAASDIAAMSFRIEGLRAAIDFTESLLRQASLGAVGENMAIVDIGMASATPSYTYDFATPPSRGVSEATWSHGFSTTSTWQELGQRQEEVTELVGILQNVA